MTFIPRRYLCHRAIHLWEMDGRLDKPFWEAAAWSEPFVDIEGDLRPPPRFLTRMKILWDDSYLYIGAELEEPHVWAMLTEHDSVIFQDNDFEVFLDPDGDNHDYYEIEINALNTTWDLRLVKPYRDGGPALNEWEIPGFRSAVHIDGTLNDPAHEDKGWSLEMALPWNVLGEYARCAVPPQEGDSWRINFSRVEWDITIEEGGYRKIPGRLEHNWVWSPQGVIDMHRPERWGYVQFTFAAPGTGDVAADAAGPARELLMSLYYAQRSFREAQGRWAERLEELAWKAPEHEAISEINLQATAEGFTGECLLRLPDGESERWFVREDSRLWAE